jgi:hypothetical protein
VTCGDQVTVLFLKLAETRGRSTLVTLPGYRQRPSLLDRVGHRCTAERMQVHLGVLSVLPSHGSRRHHDRATQYASRMSREQHGAVPRIGHQEIAVQPQQRIIAGQQSRAGDLVVRPPVPERASR